MKKILSFILVVVLVAVFLISCNESTITCETLSQNINMKLDKLTQTVTQLDSIDNQYIANPDILHTNTVASYIVPNPQQPAIYNPAKPIKESNQIVKRIIASTLDTNDIINNMLIEKIKDNLKFDQNGNCYVCGKNYTNNDNNGCENCNSVIVCDENGNCKYCHEGLQVDESGKCSNCENVCIDGNCGNIYNVADFNTNSKSCSDKYKNLLETNAIADNIALTNESVDTVETEPEINQHDQEMIDYESTTNTKKPRLYYYYEEYNVTPDNIKYTPRYISNNQIEETQNNLNNYVIKIQKLYAMTADVVEANNTLSNYKENLLNTIKDTKNINASYKNIQATPTQHQVQAIKNYLYDLDTTTKHFRQTNGDLNNEINNINKTNNLGITNSIDVMNSNYLRILNHLDTRITYHELALSTLEQLKVYLLENIEQNQTIPNNLDNTITEEILPETNTQDDYYNDENISNTTQEQDSANTDNQENIGNSLDTDEIITDEADSNDSSTSTLDNDIDSDTTIDDGNNDSMYNNNLDSNIDTYNNDDVDENILLQDNKENNIPDNLNVNNNSNFHNEDIIDNNFSYNNTDTNLNKPNSNRIINENNLNTDNNRMNGTNYMYDSDGNLYNTNNNLLDHSGKHNNVNTYEYNTLLDSLNQGTIDNGINNL